MSMTRMIGRLAQQAILPNKAFKARYQAFRSLLTHDQEAHRLMADLEEIYYNRIRVDLTLVEKKYKGLAQAVRGMVQALAEIDPLRQTHLDRYLSVLDGFTRFILTPPPTPVSGPYTIRLGRIKESQYPESGGKAYNLALIKNALELNTPRGFVITSRAFNLLVAENDLRRPIDDLLSAIRCDDPASLPEAAEEIQGLLERARIPGPVEDEILSVLRSYDSGRPWAIRSSAVAEDGLSSFAGQYESILNVADSDILTAYKKVLASKYSARAISYRIKQGLSDAETPMAVLALEMIQPRAAGVIYTRPPGTFDSDQVEVYSVRGLGEALVGGQAEAHIHRVSRLDPASPPEHVPGRSESSIDPADVSNLARGALELEEFFGEPQDVEWAIDREGRPFILQSRPIREADQDREMPHCDLTPAPNRILLSGGQPASAGIGMGPVFKVQSAADLDRFPQGAVLVAAQASPSLARVADQAQAIVTETGSPAGHLASVAREFKTPMIVGVGDVLQTLSAGLEVTVHAGTATIYEGLIDESLALPCIHRDPAMNSPLDLKLRYLINFISPLSLTDPRSESFKPESTRSLHDIIRYTHEQAIQAMFLSGERKIRRSTGAKKLISDIPMLFFVIDVGGGLAPEKVKAREILPEAITSEPMLAVMEGLTHPAVKWGGMTHFNWAEYDRIVMSGGIISAESGMLASYAVVGPEYLNLNLRFGYHFVILDALASDRKEENHILFRFTGGGADLDSRSLRAEFLELVLARLGFETEKTSDLIQARSTGLEKSAIRPILVHLGRLLGATRLMDMYLKDESQAVDFADQFMAGRSDFATVGEESQ